jgi:sugar phosphate permease
MALPFMSRDLHMDPVQAGNVAGIFFWGYLLLQVPAGHIANRWSAKTLITVLLVMWGLFAIGCGLIHSYRTLRIMRFLLGLAESGVWPATLVLVANWFPRRERALANALWMICLPMAVVISSPFSGWVLDRWSWRTMMIIEGSIPLLWTVVWVSLIHDYPREAPWLSKAELNYLESSLAGEAAKFDDADSHSLLRALLSPQVLLLSVISFLRNMADFGFLVWFPTVLENLNRFNNAVIGVLLAIPFMIGTVAMIATSWSSDRFSERRTHMSVTFAIGGLFLLVGVALSRESLLSAFLCFCLTGVGTYGYAGPFWSIPTETLPRKIAGPAMGFINGNGNLGAFVGSIAVGFVKKYTGGFAYGFGLLGSCLLLASLLCFLLRRSPVHSAEILLPSGHES